MPVLMFQPFYPLGTLQSPLLDDPAGCSPFPTCSHKRPLGSRTCSQLVPCLLCLQSCLCTLASNITFLVALPLLSPLLLVACSWCQLLEKEGVISKFVPIDFGDADTVFDRCLQVSSWVVWLGLEGRDAFPNARCFNKCLQVSSWEVWLGLEGRDAFPNARCFNKSLQVSSWVVWLGLEGRDAFPKARCFNKCFQVSSWVVWLGLGGRDAFPNARCFNKCLQVSSWVVWLGLEGRDAFPNAGCFDKCLQVGSWENQVVEREERMCLERGALRQVPTSEQLGDVG